jgi:hypothetical protein
MASFTRAAYDPTDGISNTTSFPSSPGSGTAFRAQFQELYDQAMDAVNDLMTALESVTTSSSGAENIGSAAISGLEVSAGVSATTIHAQIVALKAIADAAVAGTLTPGCLNASNLFTAGVVVLAAMAANSVDSDQYVDASIDYEHLSAACLASIRAAFDGSDLTDLSVTGGKIANGGITEGKIGTGAVSLTKFHSTALSSLLRLDGGTAITASTDLDDVGYGTYNCASSAIVATLTNCPTTLAFTMDVKKIFGGATIYQTLTAYNGAIYGRYSADGTTYSAWKHQSNEWTLIATSETLTTATTQAIATQAGKSEIMFVFTGSDGTTAQSVGILPLAANGICAPSIIKLSCPDKTSQLNNDFRSLEMTSAININVGASIGYIVNAATYLQKLYVYTR